jgi:opacity protein-like surface antigen
MKKFSIASVIVLASIGAQAQTYGEIGYTPITTNSNEGGDSFKSSPTALRGILGYEFNPNLAIEGMAAFGLSNSDFKVNGVSATGTKVKIDNAVGIYLKPKTKLNDKVEIFGRVGYVHIQGTTSLVGYGSETNTENSFSFGAGFSYAINPTTSLNVDYMQYVNKDGFTVNGFTFGVGFKF